VQELLGHTDLSSTQIYTKLDLTFLKKAHTQYHPRQRKYDAE
jgi:integrase/recombinase XerC